MLGDTGMRASFQMSQQIGLAKTINRFFHDVSENAWLSQTISVVYYGKVEGTGDTILQTYNS